MKKKRFASIIFLLLLLSAENSQATLVSMVRLAAVGDILIHDRVYKGAEVSEGKYDFNPMMKNIKPLLDKADFCFGNAESLIRGYEKGLSGFPKFNSPIEVGYEMKELGFDILNMANNHAMDLGEEGLKEAIMNMKDIGLPQFGAYLNEEDHRRFRIAQVHGMKIVFIGYTWKTNVPGPEDKDYLVNIAIVDEINKDIKTAKKLGDVVVLSLHYGSEYKRFPTEKQLELVDAVIEAGPHIILGHHPHVLQPTKWLTNSKGQKIFVAYSLGNFYSGQDGLFKQIGGVLYLDIQLVKKDNTTSIEIKNPSMTLTYVSNDEEAPWTLYEMNKVDGMKDEYEEMKEHMRSWMPELKVL